MSQPDGYELIQGAYTRVAFRPLTRWEPSFDEVCLREGISEVALNTAVGWPGDSLADVARSGLLQYIDIFSSDPARFDLTELYGLPMLAGLRLAFDPQDLAKSAKPLDFKRWPNLRAFACTWSELYSGVFASSNLHCFSAARMDEKSVKKIESLKDLRMLDLWSPRITTLQLNDLNPTLKKLSLVHCRKLESLDLGDSNLSLRWLRLSNCPKFSNIQNLYKLQNLRRLEIEGRYSFPSFESFLPLESLEQLQFIYGTIAAGDASSLLRSKSLRSAVFTPRRGYDMTWKEVDASLRSMGRPPALFDERIEISKWSREPLPL